VSERTVPEQLTLICSRSHRPVATDELKARLGIAHELASGSVGLKVGHIVEQNADVYVHMSDRSSAWDACAPEAVLVAAGGRFTDLAGEPIRYGVADVRMRRGLLACNAAAFDAVVPKVRELCEQRGTLRS
jgi:3'(2'), 5'-bisphosphate nucleotidase